MKKLSRLFLAGVLGFSVFISNPVFAQDRQAIMFLKSENSEVLTGNRVFLDLKIVPMGRNISNVDAVVVIEGNFDPNLVTYNMHPLHTNQFSQTSGMKLVNYYPVVISNKAIEAKLQFSAIDSSGFNEGSSEVPLFQFGLNTVGEGEVRAYIKELTIIDTSGNNIQENYSPISKPYSVNIYSATNVYNLTATPSPTTATSTPTMTPSAEQPYPDFQEDINQLKNEVSSLNQKVDSQQQDIGIIKRILQSIMKFFRFEQSA